MDRITVIKAYKRKDLWDYNTNKPLEDDLPVGYVMDTDGAVPESFIKWSPNKIFDRRKYPELYTIFGKDHLPNDLEMKCYVQKHYEEWHSKKDDENSLTKDIITLIIMIMIMVLTVWFALH